jgi:hypothetical protein
MRIFNTARIKYDELYADAVTFLEEKYGQSRQVFSLASPFGQLLAVILSLGRLIMFYIEDSITELNIYKAQRDSSVRGLSRLTGHNPTRAIAASGNIKLSYNGTKVEMYGNTLIIPQFLKMRNDDNGLPYIIVLPQEESRLELVQRNSLDVKIMQGSMEVQLFTGTGGKLQSFEVSVKDGYNIDQNMISVFVNNVKWTPIDSILDMSLDDKNYIVKTGLTKGIDIFFGNGYYGMKPPTGAEIRVEYLTTSGVEGNIRQDEQSSTWKFEESGYDLGGNELDLSELFNISFITDISFGTNKEPLSLTRLMSPNQSRNFVLANPVNYIYFLNKFNYFSIIDAYTTYDDNDWSDDNVIYLFLIPDINKRLKSNENYFTVPITEFRLKNSEKQKIYGLIEKSGQRLTSVVNTIVDPVLKKYIVNISLTIFESFSSDFIRQQIESKLSDYFLSVKRRDKIPKSDLIAIIENIEGVDSVNVWFLSEENEIALKKDSTSELKGLDKYGDIIFNKNEYVLIRGGWSDKYDVYYDDSIDPNRASIINIEFRKETKKTYNEVLQQENMKILKK